MVEKQFTAPLGAHAPDRHPFTILEVHDPADDGDVPVLVDGAVGIVDLARSLASGGFALLYDPAKRALVIQHADLGAARAAFLRMRLRLRACGWRLP